MSFEKSGFKRNSPVKEGPLNKVGFIVKVQTLQRLLYTYLLNLTRETGINFLNHLEKP